MKSQTTFQEEVIMLFQPWNVLTNDRNHKITIIWASLAPFPLKLQSNLVFHTFNINLPENF